MKLFIILFKLAQLVKFVLALIYGKTPLCLYLQVGKAVSVKTEKNQWVDLGIPTSCISSPARCDYNGSTIAFWMRNVNLSAGGILSSHETGNYSFFLRNVPKGPWTNLE